MSYPPEWECDVFVSFKSYEPVDTFTSDLFKRLDQVGIRYFKDDKRKRALEDFKGKRDKALKQVRFVLVVFCKSYVDSRCLDGQVELCERKNDPNLVAIPICYLTDRAVASRKLAEALGKKTEEISGYDLQASNDNEWEKLIDKIVERLVNEIFSRPTEKNFGPFGDKDETSWRHLEIKNGISAVYTKDGIKSITFEVEESITFEVEDGARTEQKYLGNDEDGTYEVKFEEEEHIISFAGYFHNATPRRITGLIFRTSKRMLGPFGKTAEEYFYVPSKGQKVIEFFAGEGGTFLKSIGARVEQGSKKLRPDIVERVGLIGKRSEYKWDDGHHHANVREISRKYDPKSKTIRSIKFGYDKTNREFWPLEEHGQMDAKDITIDMGENPTSIVGAWEKGNEGTIKYLEFHTGNRVVKTIDVDEENDEEERKTISIPIGEIVGFYGWTRFGLLCGIGAYFKRKPIECQVTWDDKKYSGVREIRLWYYKTDSTHIRGIRFVYDDGSENGETRHYPEAIAPKEDKRIALDYPREYLISISGCTQDDDAIKSLTFHSNRTNYGRYPPVEEEEEDNGRFFWYPSKGSRITGFYGTFHNNALRSIGVHAEAIPHIYPLKTIEPFGGPAGVDWNDGVHTDVRAFRVSYDNRRIRSISFMYDDNGSLVEGPQRGGGDAGKWIWLDFPDERLSSITVWEGGKENETIISHLEITTNTRPYGPYPVKPSGKPREGKIKLYREGTGELCYNSVGFFGRAGKSYLNAIGAHYEPNY